MSLDLLNYFENLRLRAEVQRHTLLWDFVLHHPVRAVAKSILLPFVVVARLFRNHFHARKVAHLVISNLPSNEVFAESCLQVGVENTERNQFIVQLPVYGNGVVTVTAIPNFQLRLKSANSKLIIVHAYYEEEALRIFENLKAYRDYDIVLTTSNPAIKNNFNGLFESNRSACFLVPNIGRDVLPFLITLKLLDLTPYTHFVKVHTKRSKHLSDRGSWFRRNIEFLIGQKIITDRIFAHISSERPSIYGVECLSLHDHLDNNWNWLQFLFGQSPKNIEGRFIPGTMFAGSVTFLRELAQKNLHLLRLEEENGQLDGCLVHALERYFGYLATSGGGECNTLETLAFGESAE
ncbi:MAG: rhamnan synthesis F family protein [Pseudomonadota bacterium]